MTPDERSELIATLKEHFPAREEWRNDPRFPAIEAKIDDLRQEFGSLREEFGGVRNVSTTLTRLGCGNQ
jgi:hypothetical protein